MDNNYRTLRNRMAQTRHREKRKLAEKENAALKQRILELEAEMGRMLRANQQSRGSSDGNCCCKCTGGQHQQNHEIVGNSHGQSNGFMNNSHGLPNGLNGIPLDLVNNFDQSQPNFTIPQNRMSRSLSMSRSSVDSRSSSVFSTTSAFNDSNNWQEEYVPNCQKLHENGGKLSREDEDLAILEEFLKLENFSPEKQTPNPGNLNFMNLQSCQPDYNYQPSNDGSLKGLFHAPPSGFEESEDMLTPIASHLYAQTSAQNAVNFEDDFDLITPRP